jgi:hypothetical protein
MNAAPEMRRTPQGYCSGSRRAGPCRRKQKQMGGRPGRPGPAGGRAAGGRAAVAVLRVALAAPVLNHACGGRAC